ncbi:MAG: hypothetical protein ACRDG3_09230 [Tepidiformaceae bacterium]
MKPSWFRINNCAFELLHHVERDSDDDQEPALLETPDSASTFVTGGDEDRTNTKAIAPRPGTLRLGSTANYRMKPS